MKKSKKIMAFGLSLLAIVGMTPIIAFSAEKKEYKYKGDVTTFDYTGLTHHSTEAGGEYTKNLSNPVLTESRFKRIQAPGILLTKSEEDKANPNKHWECNDINDDNYGRIVWDPATATLTLDNVNFSELGKRHDQSVNHANSVLDIAAVDPDDTVTIVIKGKNTYVPVLKEVVEKYDKEHPDKPIEENAKTEQVFISVNCNLVIKAEGDDASLDIKSYGMVYGEEVERSHAIQVWDSEKNIFHNLTIESGTLNLEGFKSGNAIAAGSVTINGGTVNATSKETSAITARDGKITINGGTVVAKAAIGTPAMYARTNGIQNDSIIPENGIVLGKNMRSLGYIPVITQLISDGEIGTYHADTVFAPNGTEGPLEDTKNAPSEITVAYNPELELNDSDSSLNIEQNGDEKILTGDNLLNTDSASGIKVEEIIKDFEDFGNGCEIKITNNQGDTLSNSDSVGTGSKIELVKDGVVIDTVIVIVKGDVDGDGKIDVSDATNMLNAISGIRDDFEGIYEEASHVTESSNLTVADVVRVLDIATNANV